MLLCTGLSSSRVVFNMANLYDNTATDLTYTFSFIFSIWAIVHASYLVQKQRGKVQRFTTFQCRDFARQSWPELVSEDNVTTPL